MADESGSVDLTGSESACASTAKSNAGRKQKKKWEHFDKVTLPKAKQLALKRNYDASCHACGTTIEGRPQKMAKHLRDCKSVDADVRMQALEQSAAVGEPQATQSKLTSTVDNVRISSAQMTRLHKLLALAFIMCGWSFRGVDSPHFRNFLSAVRTNYEPPGE